MLPTEDALFQISNVLTVPLEKALELENGTC